MFIQCKESCDRKAVGRTEHKSQLPNKSLFDFNNFNTDKNQITIIIIVPNIHMPRNLASTNKIN